MTAGTVLTILRAGEGGLQPVRAVRAAPSANYPEGDGYLASGLQHPNAINSISFGLALLLGTAGLPHLLMRFFTVPDAKAARGSIAWGVLLIGALLHHDDARRRRRARDPRRHVGRRTPRAATSITPLLAEELGGGEGSVGGDLFLAIISAVAFATILAVVAGLVIAASGAVAHDVWSGRDPPRPRRRAATRSASRASRRSRLGVLAIVASILAGETFNVSILVGLAFAVAASANLPALLMALFWPRFNTDRRDRRRGSAACSSSLDRDRAQPAGVAGRGQRGLADPARQPGDHLDPRRLPLLLAGDDARARSAPRSAATTS